jgi:hypothetical protein
MGLEVAHIFNRYGEAYRQAHDASLSAAQRRAMGAIELCRTAALGGHIERCDNCEHERVAYNSCRNRHCPKCQSLSRAKWLAARQSELLETPYFHVVFTLPDEVAVIAYQNKATVYDILFRAAAQALSAIAADPSHLGAEIGFVCVLHTWGQNLLHHPHLHCLVPGGGISPEGDRWMACRPGFFLPVKVLSRLFRGLFLHYLEAAFTAGRLHFFSTLQPLAERCAFRSHLAPAWDAEWVVYAMGGLCQAAIRRAAPSPHLYRRIYPSHRHLEQPARGGRRWQGQLSLEGLSTWKPARRHDVDGSRIYPALPDPRSTGWLSANPLLRVSLQPSARDETGPVPRTAGDGPGESNPSVRREGRLSRPL